MKRKLILLFLLIFTIIIQSLAQDSIQQRVFYTNLKVYDEISLGFEKTIANNKSFSVELGYNFGGKRSVYFDKGSPFYPRFFFLQAADKGFTMLGSLNFLCKNNNKWSLELFYRRLFCENLIYDPGYYSGTNSSTYGEYDMISNEVGFLFSYSITKLKPVILYFGGGFQSSYQEKRYTIYGVYEYKEPSNMITRTIAFAPIIKIGCKVFLLTF